MWEVNHSWLRDGQSKWRHGWSSWQGKWVLVLHGWADLGLTFSAVCCDMSVLRSAAPTGDDRLVQTYSTEGILMAPSGQVHCLFSSVVFHPVNLTCVTLYQALLMIKSAGAADFCLAADRLAFRVFQSLNSSVLLLSPSHSDCVWSLDTDLHASSSSLSDFRAGLFYWTCTGVCYIWIRRHPLCSPARFLGHLFWPLSRFPLHCHWRYTPDHQSWTSGISLWPQTLHTYNVGIIRRSLIAHFCQQHWLTQLLQHTI